MILLSEALKPKWNLLLGKNSQKWSAFIAGNAPFSCPTGALVVKSEVNSAWEAVLDSDLMVVAQIAQLCE